MKHNQHLSNYLGLINHSSRSILTATLLIFSVFLLLSLALLRATGKQDFPTDLLLTAQDLPSGFVRKEYVTLDVPNAKSLAIGFVVPDGSQFPPIRVSHQLANCADAQSAQLAYPDWEKEFPVENWKAPDDFQFKPVIFGDTYRFGCLPGHFNGQDLLCCRYIQQHKNMISEILFNLDGRHLKMEDVEKTLANLDARLSRTK